MIIVEDTARYGNYASANDIEHVLKYYCGNNNGKYCVVQIRVNHLVYNLVTPKQLVPNLIKQDTVVKAEDHRPTTQDMLRAQMQLRPLPTRAVQKLVRLSYKVITHADRYSKYRVMKVAQY